MKFCMGCMEQYGDAFQVCPRCGYIEGTHAKESYHLEPGSILAKHYIVGKVIGSGGFGTTYIGWDYEMDRKVAIKEYMPTEFSTRIKGYSDITILPGDAEEQFKAGIEKFIEESRRLLTFKSVPGIVTFFNCFKENKTAYIIMEYLDGETLKQRITKSNSEKSEDSQTIDEPEKEAKKEKKKEIFEKMPYEEAKKIIDPVLDALEAVHKEGIIHRDIAPDNIFLTKDGQVKLIDFGAARFATTKHTKSLTVLIKEGFAPAEQYITKGNQGPWTDVYSVAATFYTMLTGKILQGAMERKGADEVKRPSKLGVTGIPRHAENAIMNALNRDIKDRTQSCEEFKKQLTDENTKWNFIKQRKGDFGKWPLWLKLVSGISALAVASFILLLTTGIISFDGILSVFENKAAVPYVIGDSKSIAEDSIEDAGFKYVYANYVDDDAVAKDCIYNQIPGANAELKKGDIVYLSISCGSNKNVMPDLVGYDVQIAEELLSGTGVEIQYETVTDAAQLAGARQNTVLRQLLEGEDIAEGTEVNEGKVITLQIAGTGTYDTSLKTTVPNFKNKTFVDARTLAGKNNLCIVKVKEKYDDSARGTVLEQNIAENEEVVQGTEIEITVSKGSDIRIPTFPSKEKAQAFADENGITIEFVEQENAEYAPGMIISQSVSDENVMKYRDKLIITLSKGSAEVIVDKEKVNALASEKPKTTKRPTGNNSSAATDSTPIPTPKPVAVKDTKVEIPNVVGKTLSQAYDAMSDNKLNCSASYEFNSKVAEGCIVRQSQTGKANEGTNIALVVSKGDPIPYSSTEWTTDNSFVNNKWYTYEKKIQYYVETAKIASYEYYESKGTQVSINGFSLYDTATEIVWNGTKEYTSPQTQSDTHVFLNQYDKQTGSHNEVYLYRYWSDTRQAFATYQKDSTYSLTYDSGWYNEAIVHRDTNPAWGNYERYYYDGWDGRYTFVKGDTRTVADYTTYYVYRVGEKITTYKYRKPVYTWKDGKWVDTMPTISDTCRITYIRTVYKYKAK